MLRFSFWIILHLSLLCLSSFGQTPTLYISDENGIHKITPGSQELETVIPIMMSRPGSMTLDPDAGNMYWTDVSFRPDRGIIQRSNIDGSDIEVIYVDGTGQPLGIVIDTESQKMYWTSSDTQSIYRANLDGSDIEHFITDLSGFPAGLAIDIDNGAIYWTELESSSIKRANLDGSNVETLVMYALGAPRYIVLDINRGKMYWADESAFALRRANLDGSDMETLITTTGKPSGIAIDVPSNTLYWTELPSGAPRKLRRANLDGTDIRDIIATTSSFFPESIALDGQSGTVYWLDKWNKKIQRAPIDGSAIETLIIATSTPQHFAIDEKAEKIYWGDLIARKIQRANLDGSQIEDVFEDQTFTESIEIDTKNDMIYWAQQWAINRGKPDGSGFEQVMSIEGMSDYLDLDVESGTMYWTDQSFGLVQKSDLDGNNVETLLTEYWAYDLELHPEQNMLYLAAFDQIQRLDLNELVLENIITPEVISSMHMALDIQASKIYWTEQDIPNSPRTSIRRANLDGSGAEHIISLVHYPVDLVLVPDSTFRSSTDDLPDSPSTFIFSDNYPNPFQSTTTFSYILTEATHVDVRAFDLLGREVDILFEGTQPSGQYTISWDAHHLPAGMYMVRSILGDGQKAIRSAIKMD